MASTSLFAPQVESVQPAFIYDESQGKVIITFSFSSYNSINDISGLMYSIVDPNLMSTWGNNSMIKNLAKAPIGLMLVKDNISQSNNGYSFSIDLNTENFKTFTKNQFYQMQLYFIDKSVNLANINIIDNNFLTENKDNISLASQITLIRPVGKASIKLEGLETGGAFSADLSVIKGYLQYDDPKDNIEGIDTYRITITRVDTGSCIYDSSEVQNFLGIKFELPLKCSFESGFEYRFSVEYTTKHGRRSVPSEDFYLITFEEEWKPLDMSVEFTEKPAQGAILLDIRIDKNSVLGNEIKDLIIKRSDEYSSFTDWTEVLNIPEFTNENIFSVKWYDYFIESGTIYQYQFYLNGENIKQRSDRFSFAALQQEGFFLADKEGQLAIKLNPKISNFKYVTQESILNTLGGRFPLVRKNGLTRYRQFSLTGTLTFEPNNNYLILPKEEYIDSQKNLMTTFLDEGEEIFSYSMFASDSFYTLTKNGRIPYKKSKSVFGTSTNIETKEVLSYVDYVKSKRVYSKHLKDVIMAFLSNGMPKLFKSPGEGNMIVHLSNVSFTPNAQFDNTVYDFTATVTELCDLTEENLAKFNLNIFNSPERLIIAPFDEATYIITPYLSSSELIIAEAVFSELEGE